MVALPEYRERFSVACMYVHHNPVKSPGEHHNRPQHTACSMHLYHHI